MAKLIALYVLNSYRDDISIDTLSGFISDNGWVPYLEIKGAIIDLEAAGMVAAVPRPFGQSYRITMLGEETAETFREQLRQSMRNDIDAKLAEKRDEFIALSRDFGDWDMQHDGTYKVTLSVAEGDRLIFSMMIVLPDIETAKEAVKNWRCDAPDIYAFAFGKLFSTAE